MVDLLLDINCLTSLTELSPELC